MGNFFRINKPTMPRVRVASLVVRQDMHDGVNSYGERGDLHK